MRESSIKLENVTEAHNQLRSNPFGFKDAVHTAFDVKKGKRTANNELNDDKAKRFEALRILLQEMVDKDAFHDIEHPTNDTLNLKEKDQLKSLFRQNDFPNLMKSLSKTLKEKVSELIKNFDFTQTSMFKNMARKSRSMANTTMDAEIIPRVQAGVMNMVSTICDFTQVTLTLASDETKTDCKSFINKVIDITKNNLIYITSLAKMRIDLFNNFSKLMKDKLENIKDYWSLTNISKDPKKKIEMSLANEKMLGELIENYKPPLESFMNPALLTDRAYGCPAINVHFPNQKNMIKVFYEWFEKILQVNIFD